jgi:type II secretion system protein G
MNKSFTLVEILMMVAILGILAAIVLPQYQSHTQQAKEAAAKDNLRILRNAIELYASQHNGVPPGYSNDETDTTPSQNIFIAAMFKKRYINALPENPFNNKKTLQMIANDASFPTEPTGQYGWVYQPWTKRIKLDWPGKDSAGVAYFNY